jgi:hypothetical protein
MVTEPGARGEHGSKATASGWPEPVLGGVGIPSGLLFVYRVSMVAILGIRRLAASKDQE